MASVKFTDIKVVSYYEQKHTTHFLLHFDENVIAISLEGICNSTLDFLQKFIVIANWLTIINENNCEFTFATQM